MVVGDGGVFLDLITVVFDVFVNCGVCDIRGDRRVFSISFLGVRTLTDNRDSNGYPRCKSNYLSNM